MTRSLELQGSVADWFRFVLLYSEDNHGEGVSSLWVFAHTKCGKLSRVNQLNNELKTKAGRMFPELGLHMARAGSGSRIETTSGIRKVQNYRVAWSKDIHVETDVKKASMANEAALQCLSERSISHAITNAVEGINACPLYFPLYVSCSKAISMGGDASSFAVCDESASAILRGIAKMESWLLRIEHGFDPKTIPNELHDAVRKHCLSEIRARKYKLKVLRQQLEGEDPYNSHGERNPLNPILDGLQDALSGGSSPMLPQDMLNPDQLKIYEELVTVTKNLVRETSLYRSVEREAPEATTKLVSDESLVRALIELVQDDPAFRFTETAEHDQWMTLSAQHWARAVVAPYRPNPNSDYEVPIHGAEHRITQSGFVDDESSDDDYGWDE